MEVSIKEFVVEMAGRDIDLLAAPVFAKANGKCNKLITKEETTRYTPFKVFFIATFKLNQVPAAFALKSCPTACHEDLLTFSLKNGLKTTGPGLLTRAVNSFIPLFSA